MAARILCLDGETAAAMNVQEKINLLLGETDFITELVGRIEEVFVILLDDHEVDLDFFMDVRLMASRILAHQPAYSVHP